MTLSTTTNGSDAMNCQKCNTADAMINGPVVQHDRGVRQLMECPSCKGSWERVYTISAIDDLEGGSDNEDNRWKPCPVAGCYETVIDGSSFDVNARMVSQNCSCNAGHSWTDNYTHSSQSHITIYSDTDN